MAYEPVKTAKATLEELRACAAAWEPAARLVGNVRAGDIVAALDEMLAERTAVTALLESFDAESFGRSPNDLPNLLDAVIAVRQARGDR